MNKLLRASFILIVMIGVSCEENIKESIENADHHTTRVIKIDGYEYNYSLSAKEDHDKKRLILDSQTQDILEFFESNPNYAISINLKNNSVSYYSSYYKLVNEVESIGVPFIDNHEDEIGGINSTINASDQGFNNCSNHLINATVQLAEQSDGRGLKLSWPVVKLHTSISTTNVPDYRSVTFPSNLPIKRELAPIDFDDMLNSIKVCSFRKGRVTFWEDINYKGKSISFDFESSFEIRNLNTYIKNRGFADIGRENWASIISSSRISWL